MGGVEVEERDDGGYDGATAEEEVAGGGRTGVMALDGVAGGGDEKAGRFLLQIETTDLKFYFFIISWFFVVVFLSVQLYYTFSLISYFTYTYILHTYYTYIIIYLCLW